MPDRNIRAAPFAVARPRGRSYGVTGCGADKTVLSVWVMQEARDDYTKAYFALVRKRIWLSFQISEAPQDSARAPSAQKLGPKTGQKLVVGNPIPYS